MIAILKFYYFPSVLYQKFYKDISKVWEGEVLVEKVFFNFFSPSELRGMTLKDYQGNVYLEVGVCKVTLSGWQKIMPKATELDFNKVRLYIEPDKPNLGLPLKINQTSNAPLNFTNIPFKAIHAQEMSLHTFSDTDQDLLCGQLAFTTTINHPYCRFKLDQHISSQTDTLLLEGRLNTKTADINMNMTISKTVHEGFMGTILKPLKSNYFNRLQGHAEGTLQAKGNLNQINSLLPTGQIQLTQGEILFDEETKSQNIEVDFKLEQSKIEINITQADFLGGQVQGHVNLNFQPGTSFQYGGVIYGYRCELEQVSDYWDLPQKLQKGSVTLEYTFDSHWESQKMLNGQGHLFFDDADLWRIPIISHIYQLTTTSKKNDNESDSSIAFEHQGPEIKITHAQMASQLVALRTENGGKINLDSGEIDFYIIVAPLAQVENLLAKVPIVDLLLNLKSKLIRFRIKGHIQDDPILLVKKEPIKDVSEGITEFISGVLNLGGELGGGLIQQVEKIIQPTQNQSPHKN